MITILFNSLAFLYFSIAVFLAIIIIKNRKYQHLFFLIASYFFYWYSSDILVLLIVFSTLLDFNIGKLIYKTKIQSKRRLLLAISLIGNLGLLGIFKYTNFSIQTINYIASLLGHAVNLPLFNIILPIGISFYTFQTLSYTLDIYFKKLKPEESLAKFGLYVAFFPQLVAGPIVRAADFLPQLKKKVKITPENFKSGLTLIAWGLVKKIIFADNIAVFVNAFFDDPMKYHGSIPVFIVALAFGIQIYCDFSGYSDIAIGIARVFGFRLKLNFNKPYFATNFTTFWRKWHISLSSWLKDYLYIPLGGNRKGKSRTYINLMITMVLGGLWHGAAWNFLVWGTYHGILLAVHKLSLSLKLDRIFNVFKSYKKYITLLLTQYFIFLGWLIFRARDSSYLAHAIKKYLSFDIFSSFSSTISLIKTYEIPLIFLGLFLAIHIYTFFKGDIIERIAKKDLFYWTLYLFIACLSLYFLSPSETIQFIYFQF